MFRIPIRARRPLLWFGLSFLIVTLAFLLGRHYAQRAIETRLQAAAERRGLQLTVGQVEIPLWGHISIKDTQLHALTGQPIAQLPHLLTDLSWLDALKGQRLPGSLTVTGGTLHLHWQNGLPFSLRPSSRPSSPTQPASRPLPHVHLKDLTLHLEATHTTSLGTLRVPKTTLQHATLTLQHAPVGSNRPGALQLDATAQALHPDAPAPIPVHLSAQGTTLNLQADAPLPIVFDSPHGPMTLALQALQFSPETGLRLPRLQAHHALSHLSLDALHLALGPTPPPSPLIALPALPALPPLHIQGLHLQALTLTSPDTDGRPHRLRIADARLIPPPTDARPWTLEIDRPELQLVHSQPLRLADPTPLPEEPAETPFTGDGALPQLQPPPLRPGQIPRLSIFRAPPPPTLLDHLFSPQFAQNNPSLHLLRRQLRRFWPQLSAFRLNLHHGELLISRPDAQTMVHLSTLNTTTDPTPEGLDIELSAKANDGRQEVGQLHAELSLRSDLHISAVHTQISGRSLAHQFAAFVPGLDVQEDAELELNLSYEAPESPSDPRELVGSLSLRQFSFSFWRISDRPIRNLTLDTGFQLSLRPTQRQLELRLPDLKIADLALAAHLDLSKAPQQQPAFFARLTMPRQDCGLAADAIPRDLLPNLRQLKLRGQAEFDASLELDLNRPRELKLRVDGDLDACHVLDLDPKIRIKALRGRFTHHPIEPDGVRHDISVGRGTPEWVPGDLIPDFVKTAAWVTEDRRWLAHGGVRWDLIERALKIDLAHGRFIYGGSTITQQLVKNLYLTRTKNLARKFEEAIISWQMERILTKDEILTLYINCIEYGPNIYGLRHAASFYFDKKPEALNPLEAAFIMGLKPYPKAGHRQFTRQTLDRWWIRRVTHVLKMMSKYAPDQLSPEEVESFAPYQPAFRKL